MNIQGFNEFHGLNEKKSQDRKHEYGCAMAYFSFPELKKLHGSIEEDDIYYDEEDDSFGLEKKPHVTLLYGLLEEVKDAEIFDICMKHAIGPIKLDNLSVFESEKYDVLKFDAHNGVLHAINKELSKLPNENAYPKYHPHSTVAYLKKGVHEKYITEFSGKEYEVEPSKIVYSKTDGSEVSRKAAKKD